MDQLGNKVEARFQLIKSVEQFPLNWLAWEKLASLCDDVDMVREISENESIRNHWIVSFFQVEAYNHLHENSKAFEILERIEASGEFTNVCFKIFH